MPDDTSTGSGNTPPRHDPDQTLTRLDGAQQERAASAEHPGQQIGHYTLVSLLGEGGFGTVWLAEQHEPVRRHVALKIIKLGMDTRQVIARFEAERQALAVMDHPNIAKVFDAGTTETGRPYFVMEYAEGVPFTAYCDEHHLSVRERLGLFQKVCHAVQHAHQKGIIHRDIKPSNVLVTIVDGEPAPKVIDFGIAKATEARLTEHSMFTEQGQVIGTPTYMSPEQAGTTAGDIDTRSDVYALGVLLYEVMTGDTPFDARTLLSAGMEEIRRIIREVDPPKPSTRLSKAGEALTTIAQHRGAEPRRLNSQLTGDIDWIVMKAIEKDRARRYQTASGFAEDIDRFLNNEPVLASPPSARYRMGKFVRRNRRAVIAGMLVMGALLAGTAGTTIGLVRATRAERVATRAAADAEYARGLEAEQRVLADDRAEEARVERDKAEQVAAFLTDMLAGVGAQVAQGADTTLLRGILDKTAARIGEELGGQPDIEATIRSHLGVTYLQIRDFDGAEENFQRSLELYRSLAESHDDPDLAQSLGNLGLLRKTQNRYEEAEAFQRDALAMWQRLDPNDTNEIGWAMMALANTIVYLDKEGESERLLLGALHLFEAADGDRGENVGVALNSLANLKQNTEDFDDAEGYYRRALAAHRESLGDDHPFVATDLHNLGMLLAAMGRNKEAIELLEQALERNRVLYPDGHEETASCLVQLGMLFRYDDERSSEAPAMLEEAIALQSKLFGEVSQVVGTTHNELGRIYRATRQYEEAIAQFEQATAIFTELYGEQNNNVAVSMQGHARALASLDRYDEAEAMYNRVLEIQTALFGEAHPEPAITLVNIGAMHRQAEHYDAAEAAILRALEIFGAAGLERSAYTASSYENLGRVYRAQDRLEDSADALRLALDIRREISGPDSRTTLGASYALAGTLIDIAAYDEGEALLLHCLEDPNDVIDARTRARIQRRHADLLVKVERYDECVSTLEQSYALYVRTGDASGDSGTEVLQELVRVNQIRDEQDPAAGYDAEVARWRAVLEQNEQETGGGPP